MNAYIVRRKKLGKTSTESISRLAKNEISVYRNDIHDIPNDPHGICFRWGCTADVPTENVVNTARAIHLVNDKTGFRRILEEHTLCPRTWFAMEDFNGYKYPFVVRPNKHHQGRNLFLCDSYLQLTNAIRKCGEGFYISQFIDKVKEYRVFCAQGRVICVAEKTPGNPRDVAWNVARGGRFDNVRWDAWPLEIIQKCLHAHQLSGLTFSGVDVMVDDEGEGYILEINSAPSLTSPYRQECFAKLFDYIIDNDGKEPFDFPDVVTGWRDVIHPCIWYKER